MTAQLIHSAAELRRSLAPVRAAGRSIGLVPTMGALHAGHGRLMDMAAAETDFVVATIFVNPIQFDRIDDYDRYPRTLVSDVEFCGARGVPLVFAPPVDEMYPRPQRTFIEVTRVTDHLCGPFRPGHALATWLYGAARGRRIGASYRETAPASRRSFRPSPRRAGHRPRHDDPHARSDSRAVSRSNDVVT